MELKSAAGLVIAFFAVFFVAILVAPTWHRSKDFQTISPVSSPGNEQPERRRNQPAHPSSCEYNQTLDEVGIAFSARATSGPHMINHGGDKNA